MLNFYFTSRFSATISISYHVWMHATSSARLLLLPWTKLRGSFSLKQAAIKPGKQSAVEREQQALKGFEQTAEVRPESHHNPFDLWPQPTGFYSYYYIHQKFPLFVLIVRLSFLAFYTYIYLSWDSSFLLIYLCFIKK